MNKSTLFDLLKLLAFFALAWLIFTLWDPDLSGDGKFDVSIETEESLGKIIIEDIYGSSMAFKNVNNNILDSAMHVLNSRLLKNIELTDYEYNIRVIKNEQINAFTLPGGNIFIFSGLIEFTDKPEELAAVLAHEIGHVEKRHVIDKLVKEFGLAIIASILTGGDAVLINEITRTILSTSFDRRQEREADEFALDLLENSNINPKAMAAFFRKMNRDNLDYDKNFEIIMTHPHNNSRIKASLEYLLGEDFKEIPFDFEWDSIKQSL